MKKIIVISEQPKDIFSDYLLGKDLLPVQRLALTAANEFLSLHDPSLLELILVVNQKIEVATNIKKLFSNLRVVAVNGGAESFSPHLTVVYGDKDQDIFPYRDFSHFQELLFSSAPRPDKLLKFFRANRKNIYYKVLTDKVGFRSEGGNIDLLAFIEGLIFLSEHCLAWMEEWAKEVSQMDFGVNFSFNRDKKIKSIVVPVQNEYRGLPIFKDGDQVGFEEEHGSIDDLTATVVQVSEGEMLVNFGTTINRRHLEKMIRYRPQPQFLNRKISFLKDQLKWFKNLVRRLYVESPINYLANCANSLNSNETVVPYQHQIIFDKETEKILRDESQVKALVDGLGPKFFNFIIGPAGTGKTFVTAALTQQFLAQNKIVLLLSHSNLGVDNLIVEVAKHVDTKQIFRFGNDPNVISPAAQEFHNRRRQEKNFFGFPDDSNRIAEKRFIKERLDKGEGLVLACTLDSYQSVINLRELKIKPDIVIIDEASRGLFHEFIPVIGAAKQKVVFIGDNRQLGNITPSRELSEYLREKLAELPEDYGIGAISLPKSLVDYFNMGFFNSLIELKYFEPNLLSCNRRSLTRISNLISRTFYESRLIPGRFNPYNEGQIIFLDTKNVPKFKDERKGTSFHNPIEAAYVVQQFMKQAIQHVKGGGKITDLVIISPYMAQVRLLKKKLRNQLLFHPVLKEQVTPKNIDEILEQLVITVDAIQGGQRKIVFVSLVRSNADNEIGFNHDIRRLNVALSRAQDKLVIIGNSSPFLGCDYPDIRAAFKGMISYVKAKGIYKKLIP